MAAVIGCCLVGSQHAIHLVDVSQHALPISGCSETAQEESPPADETQPHADTGIETRTPDAPEIEEVVEDLLRAAVVQ